MSFETRQIESFLSKVTITHGPDELLVQFFLKATSAAAERGVFLDFGTFDHLMTVNEENLSTWFPMTTSFRPDVGGVNENNGFVLLGRNAAGEVVATQAVRIFDWSDTDFTREAESLSFLYQRPALDAAPGEACLVHSDRGRDVTGSVALAGGLWFRPDYRGNKMAEIFPRIGRAYALAHWGFDMLFAIMKAESIMKKFDQRTGFRDVVLDAVTLRNSPTKPDGDLVLALVLMSSMRMVDDAFGFVAGFEHEVDAGVQYRRA